MNLSWKLISKFLSDKVERFPEEVGASNRTDFITSRAHLQANLYDMQ